MSTRYTLETERLLLRPWRAEDRAPFMALCEEEEFNWFPVRRAVTPAEASDRFDAIVRHWTDNGWGLFAAVAIHEPGAPLIGYVGLAIPSWLPAVVPSVEIGWRIGKQWWGKGLATEGAKAVLSYGFEDMLLDRIICIYEPENKKSAAVAERLGFTEYAHMQHTRFDAPVDLAIAELHRSVWKP